MILVDTSIWIDHLRAADPELVDLLERNLVVMHPAVVGELAVGQLARRADVLTLLGGLPKAVIANDDEVLALITEERLFGRGLGYVDVMLLASTMLTPETKLWARDSRLARAARDLGHSYN